MRPPLLIVGASARAAASSAARAGLAPTGVDLFADRDLAARFPAHRVEGPSYPAALADVAAGLPAMPWIYTGALENHPDLVDRIARDRPLLGVGGQALRLVRDPARWTVALREAGCPALDVRVEGDEPPGSGEWMLKPRASAMGRGIRPWRIGEGAIPRGAFLQEYARGRPMAACFVGDGGSARLAGVTRQVLARSGRGPRALYRGSIGPVDLGPGATSALRGIGATLARASGLRGPFGVDFVLAGEVPRPVEINPRYTASVEVIEEGLGVSLLAAQGSNPTMTAATRTVAKVILFAPRPAVVPDAWPWSDPADPEPTVADIPAGGTILRPGDPVLTVLARGEQVGRMRSDLRAWTRRIAAWPPA